MHKIVLLFLFQFSGTILLAQNKNKIEVAKLVKIVETSDFTSLVKLVHEYSFKVLDSSKSENGSFSYITKENRIGGNVLSCMLNSKKVFELLIFSTTDNITKENTRKEIIDLGFKSRGKSKFKVPGYIETESFTKGKIEIAYGIKDKGDGKTEYEFNFIKN